MKQKPFSLSKNELDRMRVINTVNRELLNLDFDNSYEVVIRNESAGKTLRQLKGHFGHVLKQVSEVTGDSTDYLHRKMKAKFLSKIYVAEPIGPLQEQWVELLDVYLENGPPEKFEKQAKRISLEWVKKEQMREYMDQVISYFQDEGIPVTAPDRNRYQGEAA